MEKAYFEEWATHLAELGTDFMAPKNEEVVLQSRFVGERLMSVAEPKSPPDYMVDDWAKWKGGKFLHVYTDGS